MGKKASDFQVINWRRHCFQAEKFCVTNKVAIIKSFQKRASRLKGNWQKIDPSKDRKKQRWMNK